MEGLTDVAGFPAETSRLVDALTVRTGPTKWVDTATDPAALDAIGVHVATFLRPLGPEAITCWLDVDDAVFAHAVARHLGVPVLRVENDLGLLTMSPDSGLSVSRVAAVATSWTDYRQLAPLIAFFTNRGIEVPLAISLAEGYNNAPVATGTENIVLESL